MDEQHARRRQAVGVAQGLGAYLTWGFFPAFWKLLGHVPALEVAAHRILWSFIPLLLVLPVLRRGGALLTVLASRRLLGTLVLTTGLIAINWLMFIWAVNSGRVLETSLGYFINPLVNVLLGVLFLGERLRPWQGAAVALAAAGVLVLAVAQGAPPWVPLSLGFSFGFYGLLRKRCPVDPIVGLTVETGLLAPASAAWLLWLGAEGGFAGDVPTAALLVFGGILTAVPLLLFAAAAQKLRLITVGLLQYVAPSLHFTLAVAFFGEIVTPAHAAAFLGIWAGLALYVADAIRSARETKSA